MPDDRAEEGRSTGDRPSSPRSAQLGRSRLLGREGRADAEALGRVVQAEPDDQDRGQRDLAARRGLTDREPLGEVVQPDPDGDQQRQLRAADHDAIAPRRAWTSAVAMAPGPYGSRARSPAGASSLVGDQTEQAGGEPAGEQGAVPGHAAEAAAALVEGRQAGVDRPHAADRTSQNRNSRTPMAMAFSSTRTPGAGFRMRPIGSPSRIVPPAIRPRSMVWDSDT